MDTIEGGGWLNQQELAWLLVSDRADRASANWKTRSAASSTAIPTAPCIRRRSPGRPSTAPCTRAISPASRSSIASPSSSGAREVRRLEDHRALDLIPAADGSGLAGVYMLDMRTGEPLMVRARATLLATGGGPTMYLYHTPSGDKSCDGMAMALRAGLPLRDMEMVQFHPTGLLAGPGTRMTGTVLEEGLRGSGGYLLDETGARFMFDYDKRGERATRDIVCRGVADRIRKGHASPNGGVYISMGHLGAGQRAARVQGHGRALRRLRLRSRRRQGRGDPDRALHDGRRAVQRRLHHRDAAALRGRRGHRRRARRQPARRQRRRQLDGVRRARRRQHGGDAARVQAARRSRQGRDRSGASSAPMRRSAGAAAISKACGGGSIR